MSEYSNYISLADILNSKSAIKKLPIGSYREQTRGKRLDGNAQLRIIANQILDFTRSAARQYYNPLSCRRNNRSITVKGKLTTTYNAAYNGIYRSLKGKSRLLAALIMNNEIIRYAAIEDSMRRNGKFPKLYLRISNVNQIKHMNANQLWGLLNDIVNNIKYSGNYPKTAKLLVKDDKQYGDQFNNQWRKWFNKVDRR